MLTEKQKDQMVTAYKNKVTMQVIADAHNVHRRTVQRVLLDAGVIASQNRVSEAEMNMVHVLRKYHIKTSELTHILSKVYPGVA